MTGHLIGWAWARPGAKLGDHSHAHSTRRVAMKNAVFNALVKSPATRGLGSARRTVEQMTDQELTLMWRSLERDGWRLFELKAEFNG